ncbi:hypothetical protein ACFX2I_030960 [Malus domestica]
MQSSLSYPHGITGFKFQPNPISLLFSYYTNTSHSSSSSIQLAATFSQQTQMASTLESLSTHTNCQERTTTTSFASLWHFVEQLQCKCYQKFQGLG